MENFFWQTVHVWPHKRDPTEWLKMKIVYFCFCPPKLKAWEKIWIKIVEVKLGPIGWHNKQTNKQTNKHTHRHSSSITAIANGNGNGNGKEIICQIRVDFIRNSGGWVLTKTITTTIRTLYRPTVCWLMWQCNQNYLDYQRVIAVCTALQCVKTSMKSTSAYQLTSKQTNNKTKREET